MKRAVKVAISLPDELLHRVDRARRVCEGSRGRAMGVKRGGIWWASGALKFALGLQS